MNKIKLLLAVFVLISCKPKTNEVLVEIERKSAWTRNTNFKYSLANGANSFTSLSGNLYTLAYGGINFGITQPDSSAEFGASSTFYINLADHPIDTKYPISEDIYVLSYFSKPKNVIGFFSCKNPVTIGSSISIIMEEADSTFQGFDFPVNGESIVINKSNQVLIPYHKISNGEFGYNYALLLVNLKLIVEGYTKVRIDSYKVIDLPYGLLPESVVRLKSYDSTFVVSTESATYFVTSNGSLSKVLDTPIYREFYYDGKFYGIGFKDIFTSLDGKSWTLIGTHDGLDAPEYKNIDGRVVAYWFDNLYEIIIDETGFNSVELENDGLEGNLITSISKFNSQVYVTTRSGVFFREIEDFFVEKKQE